MKVASIVEGYGEVKAIPLLIRRVAGLIAPGKPVFALRPIRKFRSKLLRSGELERAIDLAARQTGPEDAILVLIDADKDCPRELAPILLERARRHRPDRRSRVVLAKCEFESWFLAAAESLRGKRGLPGDLSAPDRPEDIRNAKGWLSAHLLPTAPIARRSTSPL